jgi:hypothetical protein
VLFGLSFRGNSSLELSLSRGDHEDSNISLGGTSDHVFDEVSVAWSIDNGAVVFLGVELI